MNSTQNKKLEQVKISTLVIGIDVDSETHYVRAFDWRGYEYSKKPLRFSNTESGFVEFLEWAQKIKKAQGKEEVLAGMEPTGHYWFCLGVFLRDNDVKSVLVNPHHVKKSKEFDDNSQSKNDRKDSKVIVGLAKDGKFSEPYILEVVHAELRTASNLKLRVLRTEWQEGFPCTFRKYGKVDDVSGLIGLIITPLPRDIIILGAVGMTII